MRTTYCTPDAGFDEQDREHDSRILPCPGSAHAAGINAVFADGSVASISYDVDPETFNCLGHREDGQSVSAR